MKKFLAVVLALLLSLTCAFSVSADVIFEPEDDFYEKHRDECQLMERSFTATETIYSVNEPGSENVLDKISKDSTVLISYTYEDKDGVVWGLISYSGGARGWVPMGYFKVVYDNISFCEEFAGKIEENTEGITLPKADVLVIYSYPSSEGYFEFEPWNYDYTEFEFSKIYTASNGTRWGYVGYLYGANGWICIDDPSNTTMVETVPHEGTVLYPDSTITQDSAIFKGGLSPIWIAVILVGAACIVTVVLIFVLTRKKNTDSAEN